MGAVRLLRSLVPLALIAALVTACGSGSSSQGAGGSTSSGASSSLELRPVYARYAPGVPFGPQIPKNLVSTMSSVKCPAKARTVQGMMLACDAGRTVYLMKNPIVTGGVATATAKQIGHGKLWFVQLTLDPSAASTLGTAAKSMTGTELAFAFRGKVLTSVIIDSSFDATRLAITGNYDKAQATRLATQLTQS